MSTWKKDTRSPEEQAREVFVGIRVNVLERSCYAKAIRDQVIPRDEFIERMVDALAKFGECPNNCVDGAFPAMPDGEPERCRFCDDHEIEIALLTEARERGYAIPKP